MATRLTDYWQIVVMGEEGGRPGAAVLRSAAAGLASLYETGLDCYLGLERLGFRRRDRLPLPVISIGNLTTGGTGKTPMTRLLCGLLARCGKRTAILSRGHGGQGSGVRLVSDGQGHIMRDAADAGDEPLLLARALPGTPVLVGKDRRLSGREAMRLFALDALVLDDGFQFWQLARDLDVVLLDAQRPFDNGHCLPRGLLREPARHLARARVVVVTRADGLADAERDALRARIAFLAPDAEVFFARHAAAGLIPVAGSGPPLDSLRDQRVLAWSAIAQPDSFARTLAENGGQVVGQLVEPDHYAPTARDVDRVRARMLRERADLLVMTEKDAVKWPKARDLPAYALRVEMRVEEEAEFLAAIMHRLFEKP